MELMNIVSALDFIQFLLIPPFGESLDRSQKGEFLLFGAILCYSIWNLRDQVLFEGLSINHDELVPRILKLVDEHKLARRPAVTPIPSESSSLKLSPPDRLALKINVDGVVGPRFSLIAVMARNWRGELVFACSHRVNTTFPLQVEANAIKCTFGYRLFC